MFTVLQMKIKCSDLSHLNIIVILRIDLDETCSVVLGLKDWLEKLEYIKP